MDIDKTELIAGQPIKLVRDLLTKIGGDECAAVNMAVKMMEVDRKKRLLARHLGLYDAATLKKAKALVAEMVKRGWLEKQPKGKGDRYDYYKTTMAGDRLAQVRFLKRIPRAKAEQIVAELIERAREINANPELTMWVERLHVFGSYVSEAVDLGDIDFVAELAQRALADGDDYAKRSSRRAKVSGKKLNWLETLIYGETEVLLLLKARNRYLSLHPLTDIEATKANSRVVYERRPGRPCDDRRAQAPSVIPPTSRVGPASSRFAACLWWVEWWVRSTVGPRNAGRIGYFCRILAGQRQPSTNQHASWREGASKRFPKSFSKQSV